MRLSDLTSLRVDGALVTADNPLPGSDAATQAALAQLATHEDAAAILAKLSADPATQTTLAAVLAKLSSDPASQTTLAAVLAKLSADPATATAQASMITGLASVDGHVDGLEAATGAPADAAWSGSGSGGIIAVLKAIWVAITGTLKISRPPLTFTEVAGSPLTLTSAWAKACTTTSATKGLSIGDASQAGYDIFWTVVTASGSAPAGTVKGLPVLAGEDFAAGLPIGDIYLRSASGAVATVMTGA